MGVTKTDSLYRKDYFGRLQELKKYAPDAFESFLLLIIEHWLKGNYP